MVREVEFLEDPPTLGDFRARASLPGPAYLEEYIGREKSPCALHPSSYPPAAAFERRGRGAFCDCGRAASSFRGYQLLQESSSRGIESGAGGPKCIWVVFFLRQGTWFVFFCPHLESQRRFSRAFHPFAKITGAAPRVVKVKQKRALKRWNAPGSRCENFIPWVPDDADGP